MKHENLIRLFSLVLACVLLSGCGSFLNREYSASEPHSAAYFGSEDRSVLRVESYQDLVNGLLMLIDHRAEEATVWFYPSKESPSAADAMARACSEVQLDTAMGAYAVDYLSYTLGDSSHNYSELHLTIGYRRTARQVSAMVHTTSVSALYSLLPAAAQRGDAEVAVRVGYMDQTRDEICAAVAQLQLELYLAENPPEEPVESEEPAEGEEPVEGEDSEEAVPEEPTLPEDVQPWQVNFYPAEGTAGIVEVLLKHE